MRSIIISLFALCIINTGYSQNVAPYLQYKTIPAAKLILADGNAVELKAKVKKGKPLLLMVFSPECDHCKHETEALIKDLDKFKDIQIVMTTPLPQDKMVEFVKHYELQKYPSIIVARDPGFVLPTYFGLKNLPFHAFYNEQLQVITGFEGSMSISSILKIFGK